MKRIIPFPIVSFVLLCRCWTVFKCIQSVPWPIVCVCFWIWMNWNQCLHWPNRDPSICLILLSRLTTPSHPIINIYFLSVTNVSITSLLWSFDFERRNVNWSLPFCLFKYKFELLIKRSKHIAFPDRFWSKHQSNLRLHRFWRQHFAFWTIVDNIAFDKKPCLPKYRKSHRRTFQ